MRNDTNMSEVSISTPDILDQDKSWCNSEITGSFYIQDGGQDGRQVISVQFPQELYVTAMRFWCLRYGFRGQKIQKTYLQRCVTIM